ncbi:7068_t:CDS:2 [Paraglomus occultum]|uniref:7068_t:CDS:1 n=1 Tax=Paraglomus occultum TaxID=144539 RepID=A0A9N9FPS0_9GLOM|nr:7068_t:CDS:2 [Paraglomus occultum]
MPPQTQRKLYKDYPNVIEEAKKTYRHITENIHKEKHLGLARADEATRCDCSYSSGVDEPSVACGAGSDCINRFLYVECNEGECPCGDACQNRRFKQRSYAEVDLICTEKKGYGVRAKQVIPRDGFILEYVGEVMSDEMAEKRKTAYRQEGRTHFYFMDLQKGEVVDATEYGGLARFINHSCKPNARVDKWIVGRQLRLGIFADRQILPDEEVTFDYSAERSGTTAQRCYCGEDNCRLFLGKDDSELVLEEEPHEMKKADRVPYFLAVLQLTLSKEPKIFRRQLRRMEICTVTEVWKEFVNRNGLSMIRRYLQHFISEGFENDDIVRLLKVLCRIPVTNRAPVVVANIERTFEDIVKARKHPEIRRLIALLEKKWKDLPQAPLIKRALTPATPASTPLSNGKRSRSTTEDIDKPEASSSDDLRSPKRGRSSSEEPQEQLKTPESEKNCETDSKRSPSSSKNSPIYKDDRNTSLNSHTNTSRQDSSLLTASSGGYRKNGHDTSDSYRSHRHRHDARNPDDSRSGYYSNPSPSPRKDYDVRSLHDSWRPKRYSPQKDDNDRGNSSSEANSPMKKESERPKYESSRDFYEGSRSSYSQYRSPHSSTVDRSSRRFDPYRRSPPNDSRNGVESPTKTPPPPPPPPPSHPSPQSDDFPAPQWMRNPNWTESKDDNGKISWVNKFTGERTSQKIKAMIDTTFKTPEGIPQGLVNAKIEESLYRQRQVEEKAAREAAEAAAAKAAKEEAEKAAAEEKRAKEARAAAEAKRIKMARKEKAANYEAMKSKNVITFDTTEAFRDEYRKYVTENAKKFENQLSVELYASQCKKCADKAVEKELRSINEEDKKSKRSTQAKFVLNDYLRRKLSNFVTSYFEALIAKQSKAKGKAKEE